MLAGIRPRGGAIAEEAPCCGEAAENAEQYRNTPPNDADVRGTDLR